MRYVIVNKGWAIKTVVAPTRRGPRLYRMEIEAARASGLDWARRTVSLSAPLLPVASAKA